MRAVWRCATVLQRWASQSPLMLVAEYKTKKPGFCDANTYWKKKNKQLSRWKLDKTQWEDASLSPVDLAKKRVQKYMEKTIEENQKKIYRTMLGQVNEKLAGEEPPKKSVKSYLPSWLKSAVFGQAAVQEELKEEKEDNQVKELKRMHTEGIEAYGLQCQVIVSQQKSLRQTKHQLVRTDTEVRFAQHQQVIASLTELEVRWANKDFDEFIDDDNRLISIGKRAELGKDEVKDCFECYRNMRRLALVLLHYHLVEGKEMPTSDAEVDSLKMQLQQALFKRSEDMLLENRDPAQCPILPHLKLYGPWAQCSRTNLPFVECCGKDKKVHKGLDRRIYGRS